MKSSIKKVLSQIIIVAFCLSTTVSQAKIRPHKNDRTISRERKAIAVKYFETIDKGAINEAFFNQFTTDVDFYFPKFGFAKGREGIRNFCIRVGSGLKSIHHDIKNFNIIASGNYIVVEGQESGVTKNGVKWPDNKISYGKFTCIFEFKGLLIKRFHIYVDPDFTSDDTVRIQQLASGS